MPLTAPLFERPRFRARDGSWHGAFMDAVAASGPTLTLDEAAIVATLTLGYPTGDRTVFREVTRQPWLSVPDAHDEPQLVTPPPHGTAWRRPRSAARRLLARLDRELLNATSGAREVVVLLTGGLDSRVAALTLCAARDRGELTAPIRAVTWGLPESRDVAYGRRLAEMLSMPWSHLPLGPEHVLENVEVATHALGVPCSPLHLHRMAALSSLGPGVVVIAASYGDGVGRAEFSGRHLLELDPLTLPGRSAVTTPQGWRAAQRGVVADLRALHQRRPGAPAFALREYEMQGLYMRNMLAHAMCVIEQNGAQLVQAFTSPDVYPDVWAMHPSARNDLVYAEALSMLSPQVAALPWARTNRALRGATRGVDAVATRAYHRYTEWTLGAQRAALIARWPDAWLSDTRLLDRARLDRWRGADPNAGLPFVEVQNIAWLAALGDLFGRVEALGISIREAVADDEQPREHGETTPGASGRSLLGQVRGRARAALSAAGVVDPLRKARRSLAMARAVVTHPPSLSS